MNPEILDSMPDVVDHIEKTNWKNIASKIINTLWKSKDANIFHSPVDVVKF